MADGFITRIMNIHYKAQNLWEQLTKEEKSLEHAREKSFFLKAYNNY